MNSIRLLTPDEQNKFKLEIRNAWEHQSSNAIKIGLSLELRLRQRVNLRVQVLEEILNDKTADYKVKQYAD